MKKIVLFIILLLPCCTQINSWEKGIVNYTFIGKHSTFEKILVKDAMGIWEESCNVKFNYIENPKSLKYIYAIYKIPRERNICYSTVGKQPYPFLKTTDYSTGTLLHELGHCLGLRHEHQRPDRDNFIDINWSNIRFFKRIRFVKLSDSDFMYPYRSFPYDYKSIMHYRNNAFSKNGKKTIKSKERTGSHYLSEYDILKANYIYKKRKN